MTDERRRPAPDPIIGDNGLGLRQQPPHPCVELVLNGLAKGKGGEFVFPDTAARHLRAHLTALAGSPQYGEALRALVLFAVLLDRRGSPGAAKSILDAAEACAQAAKQR